MKVSSIVFRLDPHIEDGLGIGPPEVECASDSIHKYRLTPVPFQYYVALGLEETILSKRAAGQLDGTTQLSVG